MTDNPFPPERLQHDRITRDSVQSTDSQGGVGVPYRVEGLLGRLERHGDIGPGERMAGERFQELFEAAHGGSLCAVDMARSCHAEAAGEPKGVLAREEVHRALMAMGGHGSASASVAWFILGHQMTLREWSVREGWNGRAVSPHVTKGLLIATLGILKAHFRF